MVKNYHQITSQLTMLLPVILLYVKSEAKWCSIDSFLLYSEIQLWSTWHAGAVVIVRQTFNENDRYSHKHKHTNHQSRQAAFKLMPICLLHTRDLLNLQDWKKKNTQEEKTQQGLKSIRRLEWAVNRKCESEKSFPQLSLTPYNITGTSPALSRGL